MEDYNFSSTGRFVAGVSCANIDFLYGPYASLEAANDALEDAYEERPVGFTVGITQQDGSIKEYWYQPDGQGGSEFVEKQSFNNEEYNTVDLLVGAQQIERSSLDTDAFYVLNTSSPQAAVYVIPLEGYKKIKITAGDNSTYLCIVNQRMTYGAHSNATMESDYMVRCPGYVPNEVSAYRMRLYTASSQNEPHGSVEITLTPSAKFLYVQKRYGYTTTDFTPASILGYTEKEENTEGSSHNVGLELHQGSITATGEIDPSVDGFYTSPISMAAGFWLRLHDPYVVTRIIMYDKNNNIINYGDAWYNDGWKEYGLNVILPQYYFRLLITPKAGKSERLDGSLVVEQFVTLDDPRLSRESPVNTGNYPVTVQNWKLFQHRIKQLINPVWKALEYVPRSANNFLKGTVNRGTPYSEAAQFTKYVGQHVAFRTFLSALLNPRSVMYTEDIRNGSTQTKYNINNYSGMYDEARSYYGAVCTSLTSYVLGLSNIVVSYNIGSINGMTPIAKGTHANKWRKTSDGGSTWAECDPNEIWEMVKPMDLLFYTGHGSFVGDIYSDEDGERRLLTWVEQTTPKGRIIPYSKEAFLKRLEAKTEELVKPNEPGIYKQWIIYRYQRWFDMGSEKVRFDEPEDTPYIQTNFMMCSPHTIEIDPDIQICLGDYPAVAAYEDGYQQDVPFCLNVHRGGKYTMLEIYGEEDDPTNTDPTSTLQIGSNTSNLVYNSTNIYETTDGQDAEDWVIIDLRNASTTLHAGKYKARVTGNGIVSGFVHFQVVHIELDFDSDDSTVTFSVTGGTPYLIRQEKNDGNQIESWEVTAEDITNRSKTITLSNNSDYHNLKLLVKSDYGVVTKTYDLQF